MRNGSEYLANATAAAAQHLAAAETTSARTLSWAHLLNPPPHAAPNPAGHHPPTYVLRGCPPPWRPYLLIAVNYPHATQTTPGHPTVAPAHLACCPPPAPAHALPFAPHRPAMAPSTPGAPTEEVSWPHTPCHAWSVKHICTWWSVLVSAPPPGMARWRILLTSTSADRKAWPTLWRMANSTTAAVGPVSSPLRTSCWAALHHLLHGTVPAATTYHHTNTSPSRRRSWASSPSWRCPMCCRQLSEILPAHPPEWSTSTWATVFSATAHLLLSCPALEDAWTWVHSIAVTCNPDWISTPIFRALGCAAPASASPPPSSPIPPIPILTARAGLLQNGRQLHQPPSPAPDTRAHHHHRPPPPPGRHLPIPARCCLCPCH